MEENRRAAEAEAREKERIMKQIRRAEMENERMENRDNHKRQQEAIPLKSCRRRQPQSTSKGRISIHNGKRDPAQ